MTHSQAAPGGLAKTVVSKQPYNDTKLEGYSMNRSQKKQGKQQQGAQKQNSGAYLTNLQQQIYYLELEIKLLREREKERRSILMSDGMEAGPLTENIWLLKNRYSKIQKDLEARVQSLMNDNNSINARNNDIEVMIQQTSQYTKELEDRLKQAKSYYDQEGEKFRKATTTATTQRDLANKSFNQAAKDRDILKTTIGELRINFDRQTVNLGNIEEKLQQAEDNKGKMIEEKNRVIIDLKDQIFTLKNGMETGDRQRDLEDRLTNFTNKCNELEMERDNLLNKLRSHQYSKDLTEKSYNTLNHERKELQYQVDLLQQDIERQKYEADKILQRQIRIRGEKEVNIALQKTEDIQKNTQQNMSILIDIIAQNTQLNDDKNKLIFDIQEVESKIEKQHIISIRNELLLLKDRRVNLDTELKEKNYWHQVIEERVNFTQNNELRNNIDNTVNGIQNLQAENNELRNREAFLQKKLEVNEELKHIDLEEYRMIAKTNNQVNGAINTLISRWESINTAASMNDSHTYSHRS